MLTLALLSIGFSSVRALDSTRYMLTVVTNNGPSLYMAPPFLELSLPGSVDYFVCLPGVILQPT